ncbi:hypothetical protein ZW96_000107 [Salmonella enterica subsp. enterica]|nr:hypothetical protein [Salmonella enterica subsp. enterica serovar Gateshead]
MASKHLLASCHTSVGEYMGLALAASHWRSVLYYLVGGNHWQPSPMPKRL